MEDTKSIALSVFNKLNTTTAVASQCARATSYSATYIKQESDIKKEDVTTHTRQATSCSSDVQDTSNKEEFDSREMEPKDAERKLESDSGLSLVD